MDDVTAAQTYQVVACAAVYSAAIGYDSISTRAAQDCDIARTPIVINGIVIRAAVYRDVGVIGVNGIAPCAAINRHVTIGIVDCVVGTCTVINGVVTCARADLDAARVIDD